MRPDKTLIEERFREAIGRWVDAAIPPGDFIGAVLMNNLKEAVVRADEAALDNLPHIVAYLYNDCPSLCWGSVEKVAKWNGLSPELQAEWRSIRR